MHYDGGMNCVCLFEGEVAWRLYDTYGFPLDLTTIMAEERGKKIDLTQYEAAKQQAQVSVSIVYITTVVETLLY